MNRAIELIDAKARVIKPNGEVTEFNKENIKDVSDLEAQGAYKFFAIEGAELGSENRISLHHQAHPELLRSPHQFSKRRTSGGCWL